MLPIVLGVAPRKKDTPLSRKNILSTSRWHSLNIYVARIINVLRTSSSITYQKSYNHTDHILSFPTSNSNDEMPRRLVKVRKDPPREPNRLQQLIEDTARQSQSNFIKQIRLLPKKRNATLRANLDAPFDLVLPSRQVAGIVQSRGYIPPEPCSNCAAGRGPYAECIYTLDEHLSGGCANCHHTRVKGAAARCSHATEGLTKSFLLILYLKAD